MSFPNTEMLILYIKLSAAYGHSESGKEKSSDSYDRILSMLENKNDPAYLGPYGLEEASSRQRSMICEKLSLSGGFPQIQMFMYILQCRSMEAEMHRTPENEIRLAVLRCFLEQCGTARSRNTFLLNMDPLLLKKLLSFLGMENSPQIADAARKLRREAEQQIINEEEISKIEKEQNDIRRVLNSDTKNRKKQRTGRHRFLFFAVAFSVLLIIHFLINRSYDSYPEPAQTEDDIYEDPALGSEIDHSAFKIIRDPDLSLNSSGKKNEEVCFLSDVLQRCISYALYSDENVPIHLEDVYNITEIHAPGLQIWSLEGISALSNLKTADFEGTFISDLEPLGTLTQLTFLNVAHTNVWKYSPLNGCGSLIWLNAGGDHRTISLSELSCLQSLQYLNISERTIMDPEDSFGAMPSLEYLCMDRCSNIENIPGLENLTGLRYLSASGIPEMTSLGTLPDRPLIEYLNLASFSPADSSDLARSIEKMSRLQAVCLSQESLTEELKNTLSARGLQPDPSRPGVFITEKAEITVPSWTLPQNK